MDNSGDRLQSKQIKVKQIYFAFSYKPKSFFFFFSFFSKCSFHLYEGLNQNRNCMMLLKKGNNSKQRACNKNGSHQQLSGAFRIP